MNLLKSYTRELVRTISMQHAKQQKKDQEDLNALISLQLLTKTYIPWTTSAMRPAAIKLIINDILINDRRLIVELGAGITTLLISNLLNTLLHDEDRKLISIDHDQEWINVLNKSLDMSTNSRKIELIHAPLLPCNYALGENQWYDCSCIERNISGQKVDLLIIDGPPAYISDQSLSRYPALPVFIDKLSENSCIFLDDSDRLGEKKISSLWKEKYGLSFIERSGNVLVATKGKSWNIY